jgi:hypothetical protein
MTTVVFANIKGTNKKTAASAFITSSLSIKLSAECIKYIHNCLYYSRSCLYYARVRVVGPTLKASRRLVWNPGKNGNTGFLSSYALKLESERSVDSPGPGVGTYVECGMMTLVKAFTN